MVLADPKSPEANDATERPAVVKILLVDDHPVMRAGVKTLLSAESDLEVIAETDNGLSAVSLAQKLKPDVVLMDVSLPELGGAEATKQILQTSPSTRVLALSAHEEAAFARLLISAG